MESPFSACSRIAAPEDRPSETIDVRELPPPQPLRTTLERLSDLDDRIVLVQLNDRKPQHLYPQLAERGYEFETLETDDGVLTAIWND